MGQNTYRYVGQVRVNAASPFSKKSQKCRVALIVGKKLLRIRTEMFINKTEGNDQESIQLPNTFRPRHQRKNKTHLQQRHHNQNTANRKPKGQFLSHKLAKRLSKIKILPRHTCKDIQ